MKVQMLKKGPIDGEHKDAGDVIEVDSGLGNRLVEYGFATVEIDDSESSDQKPKKRGRPKAKTPEDDQEVKTPEDDTDVETPEDDQEVKTPEDDTDVETPEDKQEVKTPEK